MMDKDRFCSLPGFGLLLWLAVLLPLAFLLISFLFGVWSWGLMDDIGLVQAPGGIWQRFAEMPLAFGTTGRLQPVHAAHAAVFYRLFENHPQAFYVFRWVEVGLTIGIWAWLVARLTKSLWPALIFAALTLSFEKFYDAFFFLSLQEILGVFFVGLALFLCFGNRGQTSSQGGVWFRRAAIGVSFALAVLSKETFIVCPMALGLSWMICAMGPQGDRSFLKRGLGLFFGSLSFAIFLKVFIARGYSADYALGDIPRLTGNLSQWFRYVSFYHVPGLVICAVAFFYPRPEQTFQRRLSVTLGASLYILYLLVILPWSGTGHYVLPLGVFAAFFVAVFCAPRLEKAGTKMMTGAFCLLLVASVLVGGRALYYHQTYQYDTANLFQWMRDNALFRHELERGEKVRINAYEPGDTIPATVNHLYKTNFEKFIFSSNVREVVSDPKTRYFLWGPFWGNQDLRRMGDKLLWYPVFTSKHWIMFRRAY